MQAGLHNKPKVIIVGGGFGGLSVAKELAKVPVLITLIDRHNYHLFQPLLYQVATAALTPAEIASPIRAVLSRQKNTTVYLDNVTGTDTVQQKVILENGRRLDYDYLILATGSEQSYFGNDQWADYAPGLKNIDDAMDQRQRILMAFEHAEMETNPEKRRSYLTFIIVGGGPTGVEMAGAIAELAHSISEDFRNITSESSRILLVHSGTRLLPQFSEPLSHQAQLDLEGMGVEIMLNTRIEKFGQGFADLNGISIHSETIIWAAGVLASPAGKWLGAKTDRSGRVLVNNDLSVSGLNNVYVIGDTAAFTPSEATKALPGLAPVAKQQGQFVGQLIKAKVARKKAPKEFYYRDYGTMATIGRNKAVADIGKIKVTGFMGWLLWGLAHIYFLIGYRNRLIVAMSWIWAYLTYQRRVRLITGVKTQIKRLQQAWQKTP